MITAAGVGTAIDLKPQCCWFSLKWLLWGSSWI